MPINNITQTISILPPAGRRGVDVQTQFVIKQEDFQDHLQGTTVTELNTLKDQLNSRIGEINSTATTMNGYADTASAGASTATTKAGEASSSASDALAYKNQAETFKNNASASATKASQWADNNYNVEVETGKYSAKHWSTVAQNATADKIDKVASTDNAVVRFDGATGLVQNSAITIDDGGNIGSGTQSFNGFGGSGFKNYIINGNFDIAQRGETHTLISTVGDYHLDRWCSTQLGYGGTQSVQRINTTVNGANDVALRTSQVTACNNKIIQILDNASSKALRGKKMSVSFWYRAKGNIMCKLQQRTDQQTLSSDFTTTLPENIGTAIGASSGLIVDETWRYASFTTSTSSSNGYFHLLFSQDIAAGNYYEISKVQLEEGSIATPFENRPYGLELSLCQRYYEIGEADPSGQGSNSGLNWNGYGVSTVAVGTSVKFCVKKRVSPTVVVTNLHNSGFPTSGTVYTDTGGITELRVASATGINRFVSTWTASAEL